MTSAVRRVEDDSAQAWRRRKKAILGDKPKALAAAARAAPFFARMRERRTSRADDEDSR